MCEESPLRDRVQHYGTDKSVHVLGVSLLLALPCTYSQRLVTQ